MFNQQNESQIIKDALTTDSSVICNPVLGTEDGVWKQDIVVEEWEKARGRRATSSLRQRPASTERLENMHQIWIYQDLTIVSMHHSKFKREMDV